MVAKLFYPLVRAIVPYKSFADKVEKLAMGTLLIHIFTPSQEAGFIALGDSLLSLKGLRPIAQNCQFVKIILASQEL
jgi:hypothetical protein